MRRILAAGLVIAASAFAAMAFSKEKKLPSGEASNEAVEVNATCFDIDQLKETIGSDLGGGFVVIEVTLTPKGGKPLDIRLDDFLLRSDSTGEHSGPLAASQIAGSETLVLQRTQNGKGSGGGWGGFGGIMMGGGSGGSVPVETNKAEIKDSDKKDPIINVLKRKILAEKTIHEPETGLLFFPLDKEKPKSLWLIYTTPQGKLRVRFR